MQRRRGSQLLGLAVSLLVAELFSGEGRHGEVGLATHVLEPGYPAPQLISSGIVFDEVKEDTASQPAPPCLRRRRVSVRRRELKYLAPESVGGLLLRDANTLRDHPKRTVTSRDFDSPGLRCLRSIREGEVRLFKLRFRRYGEATLDGVGEASLEWKLWGGDYVEKYVFPFIDDPLHDYLEAPPPARLLTTL